jgi:acetolactate synthase-1/2/3 large subunit
VFVTSGPGTTNTVTGLVDAKLDSTPILVISCQVVQSLIATDGFQEADVVGITMAATKHNDLIRDVNDLEKAVKDAIYIALEGRTGPVLIDIPKDVLVTEVEYPKLSTKKLTFKKEIISGDFEDAARALCEAKRPVCYFGGGVINSSASAELTEIIKFLNLPATPTLMGLGAFGGEEKNNLGMLGMHGTYAANMVIHETDCILAVGVRFDDRVTGKVSGFAPYAKIIHIDIDPSEINKIIKTSWALVGDAKLALKKLTEEVKKYIKEGHDNRKDAMEEWWATINSWREKHPLKYKKDKAVIKPQDLISEVYKQTKGDVIAVTDVGQHQMWTAQYFPINKPRHWITSGGLGTMGFGLPAAIGAKFAEPKKEVIAFLGDGSIQMTCQELASLMNNLAPIKVIVFNNHFYGMVRQWQELFFDSRFTATNLSPSPDFVTLAKAYGITAEKVDHIDKLPKAISKMLSHKGSYLLDVVVDEKEHVYPMIPAGASSKEMLLLDMKDN